MPHVHSFAKRKLRYERAVACGFVPRAKLTPIGAASGAAVSQSIPVHLKSHFLRQMRVCQLAVAAQLILANAGIGADDLGRSYQCVRSWAPDSVSRGLRMLNRVYVKLRHQPLATVHVPVGAGWLRRLLALRPGSSVLCVPRGAPIAVENNPGTPQSMMSLWRSSHRRVVLRRWSR